MATPVLPTDFYKASNFFTLSGSAGAVWLFCLVIAGFDTDPPTVLTPVYLRLIALTLSLIFAITMLVRSKTKKKFEHWLFAFFNALLIFVNASGLNAIQTNLTFQNKAALQASNSITVAKNESSNTSLFGFSLFKNNVSWWPDKALVMENKKLKVEYDILKKEITQIKNKIASTESKSEIISQDNEQLGDSLNKQFATLEEITKAYSNLNNRFINTSEALALCQTDLEVLTNKINNITTLYEDEKDKNDELNKKYSIQTDELAAARKELERCQLKIKDLSIEVKSISVHYRSEQGKNKDLTTKIVELEKKLKEKTKTYNSLNGSYKALIKECNKLKDKLKECESKLPKQRQID